MQDMSLMGQVATRFMPIYQAALAKKSGGAPQIGFDDYVAMSGCVPVIGFEGMLQHYKVTAAQWTMIAGHWNSVIPTNPQYTQFGMLVQQESARIRAGGQPKPVALGAPAPAAPAGNLYPAQANPYAAQNPYANQNAYAAQNVGQQVGSAFNAFGAALGSFVDSAVGAFTVGARVMVQWSDGNRYPGTVTAAQNAQVEVAFPDGRRVWIPQAYVSVIY